MTTVSDQTAEREPSRYVCDPAEFAGPLTETRYTPTLTISAAEVEHLLVTVDGLRMQALDTGDETTWHPLSDVLECEAEHFLDGDEPEVLDPDYDACVVLASRAFPAGDDGSYALHFPPAELVSVRIAAGER